MQNRGQVCLGCSRMLRQYQGAGVGRELVSAGVDEALPGESLHHQWVRLPLSGVGEHLSLAV